MQQVMLNFLKNSAVHQTCFGTELENIPEGNWNCQRCTYIKSNNNVRPWDIRCYFCPDLKGI